MSTIKAEVTTIEHVRPHPNADNLALATVEGWQVCVRLGFGGLESVFHRFKHAMDYSLISWKWQPCWPFRPNLLYLRPEGRSFARSVIRGERWHAG